MRQVYIYINLIINFEFVLCKLCKQIGNCFSNKMMQDGPEKTRYEISVDHENPKNINFISLKLVARKLLDNID